MSYNVGLIAHFFFFNNTYFIVLTISRLESDLVYFEVFPD